MGVPYLATLAVLNFGLLLMANIQAWRARHVKSLLSESKYIAAANAVGGQAFLIGMPLLFLSRTNKGPSSAMLLQIVAQPHLASVEEYILICKSGIGTTQRNLLHNSSSVKSWTESRFRNWLCAFYEEVK